VLSDSNMSDIRDFIKRLMLLGPPVVQVTILFSDIVGFTEIAGASATEDLIIMLNKMFTAFDALVDKHGVYKVGITALH
jgi:class 3 adenylate cyclase